MQIEIQVLNIEVEERKNGKGQPYKMADVAYKDLSSGKTQSKKIASFGKTEATFLSFASNGVGRYSAELEKDGDYWVMTSATPSSGKPSSTANAASNESAGRATTQGTAQPSSKFAEDKDKVQKYIVRQSSLKAAVDYFAVKGDKKVTVDNIVETAAKFESYVFDEYSPETFQEPKKIDDDDIPY